MSKKTKVPKLPDGSVKIGFDQELITLSLEQIVPTKATSSSLSGSSKYKQILSSIREIGVIEPPVVIPESAAHHRYILLDGHMRLEALKEIGVAEVDCLISSDDEAFTYNKHVNRLSPIQEHRMIRHAIARGVPEEKIAKALNLDIKSIITKQKLLDGICPEAIDLLKDKMVATGTFPILKKMKSYRQIEVVTLMNDTGVYTPAYAKALLAATPSDQLLNPEKPKQVKGLSDDRST